MQVEKFIEKDFVIIQSETKVESIRDILVERLYAVVFDDDKYIGIITSNDTVNNQHKLVIDCMIPRKGIDCKCETKDAVIRMLEDNTSVLPVFKNKTFIGILSYNNCIGHVTDQLYSFVSDQKTQEEIVHKTEKIRRAFLKNISHEIRTPLNAIIGFSELLVKNNEIEPKNRFFTKVIRENTNELICIIEDLIEISQIEAGEIIIKPDYCSIEDVFGELFDEFSFEMKMKDKTCIKLSYKISDYYRNYLLLTDKLRLKQSLSHLINNALKYTEEGEIEFGCKAKDGGKIVFYVRDTGAGMTEDMKEEVFKSFTKVAKKIEYHKGTGLGLFITRRIVELLGGEIWFDSELNTGSTFYFALPFNEKICNKELFFHS